MRTARRRRCGRPWTSTLHEVRATISSSGRHTAAAARPGIVQTTVITCMLRQCADMANILALKGTVDQGRRSQLATVKPKVQLSHVEMLR